MSKIQVLLSAYNGEKYLKEQLNSLFEQKNVDLKILVRDDGSTDGTREILKNASKNGVVEVVYGRQCGVVQSFFELMQASDDECGFFAFCDQDDIWLENKLSRAVEILQKENPDEPLLYTSRSEIVNENLEHLAFWEVPRRKTSFYNAMIQNVSCGNTQVFNKKLRDLLLKVKTAEDIAMHDHFAYLTACAFGKVIFDDAAFIQYRQHGQNEIGMSGKSLNMVKKGIHLVAAGKTKRISFQIRRFLLLYGDDLKPDYRREAQDFLNGGNFIKRLRYVFRKKAYYQGFLSGLAFWILYLLGCYKIEGD